MNTQAQTLIMPTNVVFIINMPSVNIEIEWVNCATYIIVITKITTIINSLTWPSTVQQSSETLV